ncbi:hypothetical protein HDC90_001553 [Pedobacter sp. AK013]|nr:hypothetical protein [Pedobacter sp. AK013]
MATHSKGANNIFSGQLDRVTGSNWQIIGWVN